MAIRHQRSQVTLKRLQIKGLKLLGIADSVAKWIKLRTILVQDFEVKLIWPPIAIAAYFIRRMNAFSMHDWAFAAFITVHWSLPRY